MKPSARRTSKAEGAAKPRDVFLSDLVAGLSVALVLIPQSLAYAELAGLPAFYGLYAAAVPPIAAALFASSPFLQTGPTALTSLLTLGVLSSAFEVGSPQFVAAAALLALLVGILRVSLGFFRLGFIAYFLSQPVLLGFTSAAAVLIIASQLPAALGLPVPEGSLFSQLTWALEHVSFWNPTAIWLSLLTLSLILGGRHLSALFPGVLVAMLVGIGVSRVWGIDSPIVGSFDVVLLRPVPALPWAAFPDLLLGAVVIAVVGFAEPAAIARTFSSEQPGRWNPNRELVSQGVANLAAGFVGAFPVGGSFSRSSLNKLAGAKTRWSGLVTGLCALAFLPFAGLLSPLPKAVLAAVVIAAVVNLLDLEGLVKLWRYAKLQALTAYATFALTLLLAPRVDYAVLLGIGLAVAAHLYREADLGVVTRREGNTLYLALSGVLWFGSAHQLEEVFERLLEAQPNASSLVIDTSGLGRVDLSGSLLLAELIDRAEARGLKTETEGLEPHMQRVLGRVQRGKGP